MSEPDVSGVVSWDHQRGTHTTELPRVDSLLLVTTATPGYPKLITLSGEAPPLLDSDRDRALLRAFCTLALQRLDEMEQ